MDEDSPWHEWSTWISLGVTVAGAIAGSTMVDRYGWTDGVIRAVALVLVINAVFQVARPEARRWSLTACSQLVVGPAACALYLVGTFVLGEPGPGGALCVAALILFAVACAGVMLGSSDASRSPSR